MKAPVSKAVRCAIYTQVSTDHGLDQEFNSLDAQYDEASAYIKSQAHAGWSLIRSMPEPVDFGEHLLRREHESEQRTQHARGPGSPQAAAPSFSNAELFRPLRSRTPNAAC